VQHSWRLTGAYSSSPKPAVTVARVLLLKPIHRRLLSRVVSVVVVKAKRITMPALVTLGGECPMVNDPWWGIVLSKRAAAWTE
jgi:hypothetical protein